METKALQFPSNSILFETKRTWKLNQFLHFFKPSSPNNLNDDLEIDLDIDFFGEEGNDSKPEQRANNISPGSKHLSPFLSGKKFRRSKTPEPKKRSKRRFKRSNTPDPIEYNSRIKNVEIVNSSSEFFNFFCSLFFFFSMVWKYRNSEPPNFGMNLQTARWAKFYSFSFVYRSVVFLFCGVFEQKRKVVALFISQQQMEVMCTQFLGAFEQTNLSKNFVFFFIHVTQNSASLLKNVFVTSLLFSFHTSRKVK